MLHVGSCVDNSRILTILTECATEGGLGEDISDLPAVGICPEYMSEKALAIGCYCAASGAYVLFGLPSPVENSPEVVDIILNGWLERFGGGIEFEPDIDALIDKAFTATRRASAQRWAWRSGTRSGSARVATASWRRCLPIWKRASPSTSTQRRR